VSATCFLQTYCVHLRNGGGGSDLVFRKLKSVGDVMEVVLEGTLKGPFTPILHMGKPRTQRGRDGLEP
jgi:hypothetical protein